MWQSSPYTWKLKKNYDKSCCTIRAASSETFDYAVYFPLSDRVFLRKERNYVSDLIPSVKHNHIFDVKFYVPAIAKLDSCALKPFYQFPVKVKYFK